MKRNGIIFVRKKQNDVKPITFFYKTKRNKMGYFLIEKRNGMNRDETIFRKMKRSKTE